ncbi:hypothetical protein H6P81_009140 [Aristolochia fimbriata]|uniref:Exostosin GT47 domain-containing protein n=1 Tax=Aristolochia fimbriata TaxID=158543 RepID=A0AAV7EJZ4_ARIFI|nr:hypothetical protein H6P81_009140 [Aristolochia fimbriata]
MYFGNLLSNCFRFLMGVLTSWSMVLSLGMEHGVLRQKLCQVEARRSVVIIVILAGIILLIQSFFFPYRSDLVPFMPTDNVSAVVQIGFESGDSSLSKDHPLLNNSVIVMSALGFSLKNKTEIANTDEKSRKHRETQQSGRGIQIERGRDVDGDLEVHKDKDLIQNSSLGADFAGQILLPDVGRQVNLTVTISNTNDSMFTSKRTEGRDNVVVIAPPGQVSSSIFTNNHSIFGKEDAGSVDHSVGSKASSATELPPKGTHLEFLKNLSTPLSDNSSLVGIPVLKKKKGGLPPVSISQMSHILLQQYASSHLMKLQRPSARERELLSAKAQIEHASVIKDDRNLYSPVFRNVSKFKRSYELMERMLKVYVYKDGEKPIFHQPLLRGIYASEGWFMKLMERNKHFTVKDPRKAHLFYLPFSTRMLQLTLYVPHNRNRKYLADYLKNYVDMIAAKYPFWNRTNGADHFLAACHDWASYETRHQLESTIRALCNADLSGGFKLGKDVSLPETYVRAAGNPLNGLGGYPADQRPTLAFYAGGVHGYLRQALLLCWENKDPDLKIFGPKFFGIETKKVYIEQMKSSKYCICPRGYEVNSPRVVEAIFYECVPVIISDNFVPPFFEVLDWESFAVFVAEKDIPKLKDILLSITEERYRTMQMRVKKVQKHFLWHPNPVKSCLFRVYKLWWFAPSVDCILTVTRLIALSTAIFLCVYSSVFSTISNALISTVDGSNLMYTACVMGLILFHWNWKLRCVSQISHKLVHFLEELVYRDTDIFSQAFEVSFRGKCADSFVFQHGECAVSSQHPGSSTSCLADCIGDTCIKDVFSVKSTTEPKAKKITSSYGYPRFEEFLHLLSGIRFVGSFVSYCIRHLFIQLRSTKIWIRSVLYRLRRTLYGSSEDIGWLQRKQGMPPVEDGTPRFFELLTNIRNGEHTLPNSFVYLLIPGLFSNHSPLYFVSTKKFFSKMGLTCHIAKIHSEASVAHNAGELKHYIEELYWGSGKRVMLLGHSKGGVDAAAALSMYWCDLQNKVAGLALVQSPYGGTPVASDILRDDQIADKETRRIFELVICKVFKGDMRALEDLTYEKRKEFIMNHKLPEDVPVVSFHTEASIAPGVIATLSLIAHAELPWFPFFNLSLEEAESAFARQRVPVFIPVAAAMAVSALHLRLRYGEQSDGLVTRRDAEVPGSVVVRPDRKLDHAWMVHSTWKQDPVEPDASEMCEALLALLVEIRKMKKKKPQHASSGLVW